VKIAIPAFAVLAAVLLVLAPLVAGCTSIPGPESSGKVTTVTTMATTPAPVVPATQKPVMTKTTRMTLAPRTTVTTPPITLITPKAGDEPKTCAGQGGTVVTPGQQCTGTYLAATDSFSCCSTRPVPTGTGNATVTVPPFDLTVNLDDRPGSIVP
jgi:hypothetical protein